jgi:hypothetical protein
MQNNFIVTSHGWSGSNWLAHSINLNKDVVCTHSARNVLADDEQMHSHKNLVKHIQKFHTGYVGRQLVSLDDLYSKIKQFGNTKHYGSVHVLRMRDLPVLLDKFGSPKEQFKVANLVRNPVDLVWSGYGQLQDLFTFDINELYWTLDKILSEGKDFSYSLIEKYKINIGEYHYLAFLGACAILGSLKKDCDAYDSINNEKNLDFIGGIKMESVTQDREAFKGLLFNLTGNASIITDNYIGQVFQSGAINTHKKDKVKVTAEQRYYSFEPWQKDAFIYFFEKFKLRPIYESFGYDFSYMDI